MSLACNIFSRPINNFVLANDIELEKNIKEETKLDNQSGQYINRDLYLLGPGDIISLVVYGDQEISGDHEILNDGTINIPTIGQLDINFLSLYQAQSKIYEVLSKELISPEVYLRLKKARPLKISIVGEVNSPGLYTLKNSQSIFDAIKIAGGITQETNIRDITIKRRMPGKKAEFKKTSLDFYDLIFKGDQTQNIYLFDRDVIILSKAEKISPRIVEIAKTNLSPESIKVTIVGEVTSPGQIQLKSNTPLVQAILAAGGPTNFRANKGNVQLLRINYDGTVKLKKYKINLKDNLLSKNNPPLKDGDMVKVETSNVYKVVGGLDFVFSPLANVATFFQLLNN